MSNTTTSYAESNEVKINVVKGTSSMIWGSQWNQIMICIKDVDNTTRNSKYIVESIGMANFGSILGVNDGYTSTSAPAPTGCFDVKNVYNLAGNLNDWTLEASNTNCRVNRGFNYGSTNTTCTRAEFRGSNYPTSSDSYDGSRAALY